MDGMSCQICGNRIVIKGISLVCTGCGNATRSNHIFSTEQDFQKNNIKRTTQHIKQRQDKGFQVHQSLQEHLKQNWVKYLKAFSKFIIHLGNQLNLDIRPLYDKYLQQFINQPINSNWTVARRGHQGFSKNRVINSKYKKLNLNDSIEQVKVEEDQDHDFENQLEKHFKVDQLDQSSVQIVQQVRKKIKKPKIPFYERRQIKYQLTHRQKDAMQQKRKQSSNRKGSHFVDMPILSDKKGFIQQAFASLSLTNPIYLALIELYFDKFYHEETLSLNQEINKIKNIKTQNKNHSKYIKVQIISQEIFKNMPPFLQIEFIFLQDFLIQTLETNGNFTELFEQWTKTSEEITNLKKRNIQFITRKLKKILEYLQNTHKDQITTQETDITLQINGAKFNQKFDQLPLDFTFGLVLVYATNLMTNNNIYPSKLIQQIKQKKLLFLDGFSRYMSSTQYQYLTVPQHIPKPSFIRENARKLLKNLNIQYEHHNKEQLLNMFRNFCLEMNVSQYLFNIAMSFENSYFKDYHVDNSLYDIYCCCLLLLAFKYYLVINKEEALKCLSTICRTSKDIQPCDYPDLKECGIEEIRQSLEQQLKLDGYYGNRQVNEKLNQKLQEVENFFDSQIIPEYHQQQQYQIKIENAVKVEIVHEDWDFYKSPDFDWEAPEVRYFEMKLTDYLDEEENVIITQFHEMEKHVV